MRALGMGGASAFDIVANNPQPGAGRRELLTKNGQWSLHALVAPLQPERSGISDSLVSKIVRARSRTHHHSELRHNLIVLSPPVSRAVSGRFQSNWYGEAKFSPSLPARIWRFLGEHPEGAARPLRRQFLPAEQYLPDGNCRCSKKHINQASI